MACFVVINLDITDGIICHLSYCGTAIICKKWMFEESLQSRLLVQNSFSKNTGKYQPKSLFSRNSKLYGRYLQKIHTRRGTRVQSGLHKTVYIHSTYAYNERITCAQCLRTIRILLSLVSSVEPRYLKLYLDESEYKFYYFLSGQQF